MLKELEKFSIGEYLQNALQCNVSRRMSVSSPMLFLLAETQNKLGSKVDMNDGSPHANESSSVIPRTGEYKDNTVSVSAFFGPEGLVP